MALVFCLALSPPAVADNYYDEGVRVYNAGKFLDAAELFEKAAQSSPQNANALYYAAISYQQLGYTARAAALYEQIVQRFPATQVAGYARTALKALQAVTTQDGSSGAASAGADGGGASDPGGTLVAPDQSRVYYEQAGDSLVVDAMVDNRPTKMIFDTGASLTLFGKNQLQALGIEIPTQAPTGMVSGVGGAGLIPVWSMRVNLQVGDIYRRNFPVAVAENQAMPLLGQTFFKGFDYVINRQDNSILFVKKKSPDSPSAPGAAEGYAVPFTTEGNEMVVTAQVNGAPYKMYFDTGAQTTAFSARDLAALGITIPGDAAVGTVSGVSGQSQSYTFPIDSLKLGPIEQYNFNITAVQSDVLPRPLLGENFYGRWQYTIDNDNKVIRFLRR
ncbi:MAG TPA: aspartyl protease family protein [Candidatus Obscuribacterales bacterium]